MNPTESAARHLVGINLPDGWRVRERLERPAEATGGLFSVGYIVEHADGRTAFLKALDFTQALDKPNFTELLQLALQEYNFERDVCRKCRDARLGRVALAIWDGEVVVDGFGALSRVPYLVFESALGDARSVLAERDLDVVWRLRMLHNAAVGLGQLHSRGIAHQDLKPSNLLVFDPGTGSKVADLGRATDKAMASPHDGYRIAGDRGYAPLEHLYGLIPPDWSVRRIGCDMYHLGSMVVFFFGGTSTTAAILARLAATHHPSIWTGSYAEVFPYVRQGFESFLDEFAEIISADLGDLTPQVVAIVRQLCEPDPSLRGLPDSRGNVAAQYSLERYVSWFDRLARRAEIGIKRS